MIGLAFFMAVYVFGFWFMLRGKACLACGARECPGHCGFFGCEQDPPPSSDDFLDE